MELLSPFAQFGLAGVVIGALFISLWKLINEIKLMNETNTKRLTDMADNHSEERSSWLQAYQANTEVLRQISMGCKKPP